MLRQPLYAHRVLMLFILTLVSGSLFAEQCYRVTDARTCNNWVAEKSVNSGGKWTVVSGYKCQGDGVLRPLGWEAVSGDGETISTIDKVCGQLYFWDYEKQTWVSAGGIIDPACAEKKMTRKACQGDTQPPVEH